MMNKFYMRQCLIACLLLCYSFQGYTQSSYQIVASTDFEGNLVQGSIETLIKEIRKGKPVRVGWQLDFNEDKVADFDHWVEADWITILGDHVFTQIRTIFYQGPDIDTPQVQIFPYSTQWTAVIGTNGKLLNRTIFDMPTNMETLEQEEIDRILKSAEVKTWNVATFWSVQL